MIFNTTRVNVAKNIVASTVIKAIRSNFRPLSVFSELDSAGVAEGFFVATRKMHLQNYIINLTICTGQKVKQRR